MRKIKAAFEGGKKAFIAYLMAGDPDMGSTRALIRALAEAGTDIIEIGIPFSDPIAEGETIQKAAARALDAGADVVKAFELAASLKGEISIPLLFMTYLNPVYNRGYERFFSDCARCGVSGVIIPDLPFEEQGEVLPYAKKHGVAVITLIAPTSVERLAKAAQNAQGFLYLVSSLGVTGVRSEITTDIPGLVAQIRKHTDVPVAVGFGIHAPEQAAEMSRHADGVIVGSAIVNIIAEHGADAAAPLRDYVKSMKAAMASSGG